MINTNEQENLRRNPSSDDSSLIILSLDTTALREALLTMQILPENPVTVLLSSSSLRFVQGSEVRVELNVPLTHATGLRDEETLEFELEIECFAPVIVADPEKAGIKLLFEDFRREVGSIGRLRIQAESYQVEWSYLLVAIQRVLPPASHPKGTAVNLEALRRCLDLVSPFAKKSEVQRNLETIMVADATATGGAQQSARSVETKALAGILLRFDQKYSKLVSRLLTRFLTPEAQLVTSEKSQIIFNEHLSCSVPLSPMELPKLPMSNVPHELRVEAMYLDPSLRRILAQKKVASNGSTLSGHVGLKLQPRAESILFTTAVNGGTAYVECPLSNGSWSGDEADSVDISLTRDGLAKLSTKGNSIITISMSPAFVSFHEEIDDVRISTFVGTIRYP